MEGASGIERRDDGDLGDPPIVRTAAFAPPAADEPASVEWVEDEEPAPAAITHRLLALGVTVLSLAWIGGMLWWTRARLTLLAPEQVAGLVAALCVPPALAGILWLLAMRTSRAEARRFGATARAMRAEAASLEQAVARLSAHVARGRTHLDGQAEALIVFGGEAADHVATLGDDMAGSVTRIVDHVERLSGATEIARGSLDLLLARLPSASDEAAAIARALAQTGTDAMAHVAGLDAKLRDVAAHGREAEAAAGSAAQRFGEHAARIEGSAAAVAERLGASGTALAEQVDAMLARAAGSIDAQRRTLEDHGERIAALLAGAEAALDRVSHESADALAARVAAIERSVAGIAAQLAAQREAGATLLGEVKAGVVATDRDLAALHDQSVERNRLLAASIGALGASAEAMTEALRTGEAAARQAIATGEDLLTGLDAAAREIDETLPAALGRLDAHVSGTRGGIAAAKPELLALVTAAESTLDAVTALGGEVAAIGRAAEGAASVADGAAEALGRRVQALGEVASAAERRVAEAETIDQEGFARRAALLTDALHSTGMELAKALSGEVPDTTWAAYLKGDRGVFTRRAVRLLDGVQARDLATLYAADAGFHDQVDRYVHDFEAMLRDVLASRNGEPLGVTLLSSDMGKLYVALAQAIERLR